MTYGRNRNSSAAKTQSRTESVEPKGFWSEARTHGFFPLLFLTGIQKFTDICQLSLKSLINSTACLY